MRCPSISTSQDCCENHKQEGGSQKYFTRCQRWHFSEALQNTWCPDLLSLRIDKLVWKAGAVLVLDFAQGGAALKLAKVSQSQAGLASPPGRWCRPSRPLVTMGFIISWICITNRLCFLIKVSYQATNFSLPRWKFSHLPSDSDNGDGESWTNHCPFSGKK